MSKFALLIGINYEKDSSHKLNGCINDVRNVQDMLESVMEYPRANISMITDDTLAPTKQNIIDGFQSLLTSINSRECSEAWIHYSGHGYFLTDNGIDELDGKDEVLVPVDYSSAGFISDDYLYEFFIDKITNPDIKLMITMDCCHSGTHMDLSWKVNSENKLTKVSTNHAKMGQIVCLSGCKDDQTAADAWNFSDLKRWSGALTSSLLHTLKESNYTIPFLELIQKIRTMLQAKDYSQIPQLTCNFDLLSMNFITHKKELKKQLQQETMKRNRELVQEQERKMKQVREIRIMKSTQLTSLRTQQHELQVQKIHYQKQLSQLQPQVNQYQRDILHLEHAVQQYKQRKEECSRQLVDIQAVIQKTWKLYSQFLQSRTRQNYQLYYQQFIIFKRSYHQNQRNKQLIVEYTQIIESKERTLTKLKTMYETLVSQLSEAKQRYQGILQEMKEVQQKINQIELISETATTVNTSVGGTTTPSKVEHFLTANNDSNTFFLIQ